MRFSRAGAISALFAASIAVICLGVGFFLTHEPTPLAASAQQRNLLRLAAAAAGLFLVLYLLRVGLESVILWLARTHRRRALHLLGLIAPRLTRRVLGSTLGLCLSVTAPTLAQAQILNVNAPQYSVSEVRTPGSEAPETTPHGTRLQVPSTGWSAQPISISLPPTFGGKSSPEPAPRRTVEEHVVASGQSLWSIAAAHLGPSATTEEINRQWPRIYELNKHVIGKNPDVLNPGQILLLPEDL